MASWNVRTSLNALKLEVLDELLATHDAVLLQETHQLRVPHKNHFRQKGFDIIESPGDSGCCILLHHDLQPLVKQQFFSDSAGRATGVLLQHRDHSLLLASLYLPSGLDQLSPNSDDFRSALAIYSEVLGWSLQAKSAIVGGDLNETISASERIDSKQRLRGSTGSLLSSTLLASGFKDSYRCLYPTQPGFTCYRSSTMTASRIDYLLFRGSCSPVDVQVGPDNNVSDHRSLSGTFSLPFSLLQRQKPQTLRLPNIRKATPEIEARICGVMDRLLTSDFLSHLTNLTTNQEIDAASEQINNMAAQAATVLPLTGSPPFRNKATKSLLTKRKAVGQLRAALRQHGQQSPHFLQNLHRCQQHGLDIKLPLDLHGAVSHLSQLFNSLTKGIRAQVRGQKHNPTRLSDHNFVAHAHGMLQKSPDPINQITSIVDPSTNQLTQGATELHDVLRSHFRAKLSADTSSSPPDPVMEATFNPLPNIAPQWYDSLMEDFTAAEIKRLGSSLKRVASPGSDGVSAGIWKILISGSERTTLGLKLLFNASLRQRYFPQISKHATIVPLLKKVSAGPALTNIRPISLQNSLFKIMSKGLAHRLAQIFAKHQILHPAQQAFIKGGATSKCIDTLLDVWEDANTHDRECVTLFYDLAGAYDTVPHDKLLDSLARIRMPQEFIDLVRSSLTDCTASIRTAYGQTASFNITRSIKQGDPLAPLLFIIFVDPLHCGLDRNPLHDGKRDGYTIHHSSTTTIISSSGYADDTTLFAGSVPGAQRMNAFAERWCVHNKMAMNGVKTVMAGCIKGKGPLPPDIIKVNDIVVQPISHDRPLRHLGVQLRFDLNWKAQHDQITKSIQYYCHLAMAHKLSPTRCIEFFNVFLLPKIEYGLRFSQPSISQTKRWDQKLAYAFNVCAGSCQAVSMKALEEITGLCMVSTRTLTSTISESFVKLNEITSTPPNNRLPPMSAPRNKYNRFSYTMACIKQLDWSMTVVSRRRGNDLKTTQLIPAPSEGDHMKVQVTRGEQAQSAVDLVFNYAGTFEARGQKGDINIYTDGAAEVSHFDIEHNRFEWTSAYAVVPQNTWLTNNYQQLPQESQMSTEHLPGIQAAAFHMNDLCQNQSAFYTELAAITRAIMATPTGVNINIFTDSLSSIQAIRRYADEVTDRRRLRISGRPFLGLIDHMTKSRKGAITFTHVRSHTDLLDLASCGNKAADFVAGSVLAKDEKGKSLRSHWLTQHPKPIPLHLGERNVVVKDHEQLIVAGDIRRSAQHAAQAKMVGKWKQSQSQGSFAGPYYKEIRDILFTSRTRLPTSADSKRLLLQQRFLLQAASNTIHYETRLVNKKRVPFEGMCQLCNVPRDVWHMFQCSGMAVHRQSICRAIQKLLHQLLQQMPEFDHKNLPPAALHRHTPLVCLVGWLVHRDVKREQDLQTLQRDADVIRACFGGFLVWEMKAELRQFSGISKPEIRLHDPVLFQQIDAQIELIIQSIRQILFQGALQMNTSWCL